MSSLLICATPVHGHVSPLLAVATELVRRGHGVRFLTGARYADAVGRTGAEFLPLPAEADFDDSDMDAAFPGRVGRTGVDGVRYDLTTIFVGPAQAQLAAMDAATTAVQTDVILVDSLFMGAALLLQRPRVQRSAVVYLGIVPLTLPSRDTAPFGLGIPPMPGLRGRVRNALLSAVADRVLFRPVNRAASRVAKQVTGRSLAVPVMSWPVTADAVVQFTVPSFEYPRSDLADTVHFVGPIARSAPTELQLPTWWGDLDGSRPIVHVTQGTVANTDLTELIVPTITGLAGADMLVVVSTGRRPLADLPAPLPANVRVAEYLPYDRLLPLTDVFVTNGGYGGVHYALEHGVPLVVAGLTEDKTEVAARIAWSGVGVNLATNRPTPEHIADAVRSVLASDGHRQASARIGADIAAATGADGLETVVTGLIGSGAAVR